MLGSLQEFLPQCVTQPSTQSFRVSSNQKQSNKIAHRVQSTIITLDDNSQSHLNQIRFAERGIPSQLDATGATVDGNEPLSSQKQRMQSDRVNNQNPQHKLKTKEFVADDKSFLLAHYDKFKKHRQVSHREHIGFNSLKKIGSISSSKQQSKPSYMHLKGKLRQNHHLLKSLVQVQEMEQANPQTFFEISFKEMCQQFQKTKLQRRIRKECRQYSSVDKAVKFPLTIWTKKNAEIANSGNRRAQTKQGRMSPGRTLLQQNQSKWINSRSKSLEVGSDKDSSKAASLERKQNQIRRRAMINKIDKLLERVPKDRKYSIKSNRRNSLYCTVTKFK